MGAMHDRISEAHRGRHIYASTACQHEIHDHCRKACKFCQEPCRCECHEGQVVGAWSDIQPSPAVWPECETCGTSWALRRNLLDGAWVWTRDCKHKGQPVLRGDDTKGE